MAKDKLTIEERVNLLIKEGIDNPKKWMPIHGYQEPSEEYTIAIGDFWGSEWQTLRKHHLEETQVLFDIIRELVKRVK